MCSSKVSSAVAVLAAAGRPWSPAASPMSSPGEAARRGRGSRSARYRSGGVEDGGGGGKGASRAAALWLLPLTACTHQYGSSPYRVHAPALHGASGRLPACISWKLCLGLPLVLDRVGRWGVCGLEEIRFGVYFGLPLLLFNSYIALTIFVFSTPKFIFPYIFVPKYNK
jgi:hypothetical protein